MRPGGARGHSSAHPSASPTFLAHAPCARSGTRVPASPAPFPFSRGRGRGRPGSHRRAPPRISQARPPAPSARQARDREANAGPHRRRPHGARGQRPRGSHTHRPRRHSSRGGGLPPRLQVQPPVRPRPSRAEVPDLRLRARTTCRAVRPAPDEGPAGAFRGPAGMRALPESGPHAGGVGALDLLQDPLMLWDVAYPLTALRHLGWKLGSRRGAPPGGRREPAARGPSAGGGAGRARGRAARAQGAGRGGARAGAQPAGDPRPAGSRGRVPARTARLGDGFPRQITTLNLQEKRRRSLSRRPHGLWVAERQRKEKRALVESKTVSGHDTYVRDHPGESLRRPGRPLRVGLRPRPREVRGGHSTW